MNRRVWTMPLWLEVTLSLLIAFAAASAVSILILRASDEQRLTRLGTGFFAERTASVVSAVLTLEPSMRAQVVERLSSATMEFELSTSPRVPEGAERAVQVEAAVRNWLKQSKLAAPLVERLNTRLRAIYFGDGPGTEATSFDEQPEAVTHTIVTPHRGILISIPDDGTGWVNIKIESMRPRASHTALLWSIAVNVLAFVLVALWISWRFASPLQRLGDAATALRQGNLKANVSETGPEPVREAARAFNQMALQVSATLKSQQVLMAAVAHDLRTPISVVRFRAEMVQDQELRSKLISTIDEMQGMTSAVLDAVRPEDVGEQPRLVDVSALTESICVDLRDAGKDVAVQSMAADATGICRETQIRRAIRNLIDNALRYGTRARVSVEADVDRVRVVIDDDGPGISAAELERVFEPFTRLENSRSKETGGFGLGLPIARLAAKNHGGDVTLENLPGKGLRAVLSLLRD